MTAVAATEFLGKARALRRQLLAWRARYDPVMVAIAKDLLAGYRRHQRTPIPLRLLESTAARWRAIGRDEGCLSQSIELSGRVLRIRDVRFVASAAQHAPDPRMEQQDNQAFCAMENSLVLKKREPLRLGIRLRTSGRSFPTIRAPMCQAR